MSTEEPPSKDSSPSSPSSSSSSPKATRRFVRSSWVLCGTLVAGCLATGAWAVPQIQQAQELQRNTETTVVAPVISHPDLPIVDAPLIPGALDQELTSIAKKFQAGNLSGTVVDASSGEILYFHQADSPRIPASNFKILTDYTVLRTTNPYARYTTSVTQNGDNLTLLAGGDTLLGTGESNDSLVVGHAGLRTLAQETISALAGQEQKKYILNLDTSMYSGPTINSAWASEDIDAEFVNNIAPIAFYSHYSPDDNDKPSTTRPKNPADQVHQRMLTALNQLGKPQGISFTLGAEKKSAEDAEILATVESATVGEQAAYMMQESDNMLAEVLGRNAAVAAGGEGSSQVAKDLIRTTLEADGIPLTGLQQTDLCGLSMDNRVSHETLNHIMMAIVNGHNGMDAALAGFPVAGGSGTLESRFNDPNETSARGYARGKTGTLNKVIALTGYTERDNGQILIYSFITNDVTSTGQAKDTIDQSVAVVTHRN